MSIKRTPKAKPKNKAATRPKTDKKAVVSDKDMAYIAKLTKQYSDEDSINEIKESASLDSLKALMDIDTVEESPQEEQEHLKKDDKQARDAMFDIAEDILDFKPKQAKKYMTANQVMRKLIAICTTKGKSKSKKIKTSGTGHRIINVRYSGDTVILELG